MEILLIILLIGVVILGLVGVGWICFDVLDSRLDTFWKIMWFFFFFSMPALAIIVWLFIRSDYTDT